MKKRPILRYHGGKWMQAKWITSFFPKHKVYVEPFGGAASVLIFKDRSYTEIYNDLDKELVNLFRVARDSGEILKEKLYLTPFSRDEFFGSYKKSDDPVEQARRTVTRSFMGFGSNSHCQNTGFRAKSFSSKTSPCVDWKNYGEKFEVIVERLRGVVIENLPGLSLIEKYDTKETLFYFDPPYMKSTRGNKYDDYNFEMTDEQHRELIQSIKNIEGFVILSGYENDLYNEMLPDWRKEKREAMACGGRKRIECLWMSPGMENQGNLFK